MLNNNEFNNLERRLWREGNPLTDELTSTRNELSRLIKEAQKVLKKYTLAINTLSPHADIDFYREWDEFEDTLDNLDYHMKG